MQTTRPRASRPVAASSARRRTPSSHRDPSWPPSRSPLSLQVRPSSNSPLQRSTNVFLTALPNALGLDLAIAISRQVDTSDLVGRVVGLKDDSALLVSLSRSSRLTLEPISASSIAIVRIVRDTLQAMLRPGTALTDTPLELERLGVVASVYKFAPSPSQDKV